MGYHMGRLLIHFFGSHRKNDFVEMGLHHIVSIYLFGGCYLFNAWETGAVIAFLHDIADVLTGVVKFLSESVFKTTAGVVFVILMIIWCYTRCLVLPYLIYQIWIMPVDFQSDLVKPFFCYLLGCMCCLHFFWFSMFLRLFHKYVKVGSTEDE